MSKIDKQAAYTKGAKKRRKKARITLPGGESAPQRIGQGRRTDIDQSPPPILAARARHGWNLTKAEISREKRALDAALLITDEDTRQSAINVIIARVEAIRRNRAKDQLHESDMGRCILALSEGQERADLAQAWADLSAARRNYLMRIIGQTGDPQGAASPMLTDTMETDPSLRVDLRSPGEKDDAAERRWLEWCGRIETLPVPQMKWALRGALDGFMGDGSLWRDGVPTRSGLAAVQALYRLTNRQ